MIASDLQETLPRRHMRDIDKEAWVVAGTIAYLHTYSCCTRQSWTGSTELLLGVAVGVLWPVGNSKSLAGTGGWHVAGTYMVSRWLLCKVKWSKHLIIDHSRRRGSQGSCAQPWTFAIARDDGPIRLSQVHRSRHI